MAKRSLKRPLQYEKDQTGCMWGLISIFDFRHGRSTRKLLSDRRRGSRHPVGAGYSTMKVGMLTNFEDNYERIEDGEESETAASDATKTSVKELMDEEIFDEKSSKKQINSPEVELKQFDSEHGGCVKRSCKINKSSKKSFDTHISALDATSILASEYSCHQVAEENTSNDLDQEIEIKEVCHQIHQKSPSYVKREGFDMQLGQEDFVFEEKLRTAIQVIIDQSSANEKSLAKDGKAQQSKEFMDALQMLSSNKELFFKLVEDPKSPFVKHIRELENARLHDDQNSNSMAGIDMLEEDRSKSRSDELVNCKNELVNHKRRHFFRRKRKSHKNIRVKEIETCQPSSRIVILKPGPASLRNSEAQINCSTSLQSHLVVANKVQGERNSSHFSFTEIKRKLKHAMGKERLGSSRAHTTHRFPCEHQNLEGGEKEVGGENVGWSSPNRNHFYTENFAKLSIGINRRDKIGKSRFTETSVASETNGYPRHGVSNIYIEAKKHLSEMLRDEDKNAELMRRQFPKTLGRILSLPEYNFSPIGSPGKDSDHGCVTAQMRLSPRGNFQMVPESKCQLVQENHAVDLSPSSQNVEIQSRADEKLPSLDSVPGLSYELNQDISEEETLSSLRDEMSSEGIVEILNITDTEYQENSKDDDVSLESSVSLVIRNVQNCETTEVCDGEKTSQCSKLDSFEENQMPSPSASPSSSSMTRKIEDSDSAIDKANRPSPISVLEPLYVEEDISPASTIARPVESVIQPRQIQFEEPLFSTSEQQIYIRTNMEDDKESAFEYVEAVLLGSGLNWDEFILRWLSTDKVLDPSLFHELELFSNQSSHDQKLLFDCTEEVLKEICAHYFGFFPRVSSVKQNVRPVPRGIDLIHAVWEAVEWHILQYARPHSLDQLVKKDMAKSGTWMDLRLEMEQTGFEIGEIILGELMEDIVLSLLNYSPKLEVLVFLDGLNGSVNSVKLSKNNLVSESDPPRFRLEAT